MSNLQSPGVVVVSSFTVPLLQLKIESSIPNSPKCQIILGPGINKETAPIADILDKAVFNVFTL